MADRGIARRSSDHCVDSTKEVFMSEAANDLTRNDRVQVLLAEYSAYRAEILMRTNNGFQLVTVSAAAAAWLLQQQWNELGFWIGVALLVVVLVVSGNTIWRDVAKSSKRVVEIEHEINSRAGEYLLVGESLRADPGSLDS